MIPSNIKTTTSKNVILSSQTGKTWLTCASKSNTDHVKVLRYFTNKCKLDLTTKNHLIKKFYWTILFWLNEDIFLMWKKPRTKVSFFLNTNIFWFNINIFSLNINSYLTKIFWLNMRPFSLNKNCCLTKRSFWLFWLNRNIHNFLDKNNIKYKNVFLQHFSSHTVRHLWGSFFNPLVPGVH